MLTIAYRYMCKGPYPGPESGLSSTLWNGAVMTEEFETEAEREVRIQHLRRDSRLQWLSKGGDTRASTSSYGQ